MKRIITLIVAMLLMSSNALAMTFSQPVKIGNFIDPYDKGFDIRIASSNNGIEVKSSNFSQKLFKQGIATFGNGNDTLYFHYKYDTSNKYYYDKKMDFGAKDENNVISLGNFNDCKIYQINNDSNIKLYILTNEFFDAPGVLDYILLGKQQDGIFVKYFDTRDIETNYFGKHNLIGFSTMKCNDNTIIINYGTYQYGQSVNVKGEFKFKWDDAAQWFSVEQIIY